MLRGIWAPAVNGFYVARKAEAGRQVLGFYELSSRSFHPILAVERSLPDGWGFLSLSPEGRYLLYSTVDRQEVDLVPIDNFR